MPLTPNPALLPENNGIHQAVQGLPQQLSPNQQPPQVQVAQQMPQQPPTPEQRIEMPAKVILQKKANKKLQATIEKFEKEPQIEMWLERNPETEYRVQLNNGAVSIIAEVITINGVQWPLQVGKNIVPKSIYEFYAQTKAQKYMIRAASQLNLGARQLTPGSNIHYGDFTPTL